MRGMVWTVFSMEMRKILAYRLEFWVQFVGTVVIQMTVAWFLWSAVFSVSGQSRVAGYSFDQMIFYFLLVPLIDRLNRGYDSFQLSREIYDGSLTRYLLYPVSLLGYKYIGYLARAVFSVLQLLIALVVFLLIFGKPVGSELSFLNFIETLFLCWLAGLCYFLMSFLVELVAFWAENVWSLMLMLRFIVQMLGGAILPLALFPDWAREALIWTPFPGLVDVPARLFMGLARTGELWQCVVVLSFWSIFFALCVHLILSRGLKQYTGVGI